MWILRPDADIFICSHCGNEAYWDTDYGQQLFDYCPYCGEYHRKTRKEKRTFLQTKNENKRSYA